MRGSLIYYILLRNPHVLHQLIMISSHIKEIYIKKNIHNHPGEKVSTADSLSLSLALSASISHKTILYALTFLLHSLALSVRSRHSHSLQPFYSSLITSIPWFQFNPPILFILPYCAHTSR